VLVNVYSEAFASTGAHTQPVKYDERRGHCGGRQAFRSSSSDRHEVSCDGGRETNSAVG